MVLAEDLICLFFQSDYSIEMFFETLPSVEIWKNKYPNAEGWTVGWKFERFPKGRANVERNSGCG